MIDRIERWGAAILDAVTGALVVAIAAILLLQVIGRYVLEYPFTWPEEMAGFLFVWVIFLGALSAYRGGHMIGISIFVDKLPARWTAAVRLATNLVVVAILVLMIVEGVDATRAAAGMRTTVTGLSWAYIYLALPIGFALLALGYLGAVVRDAREMWRR